MQPTRTQQVLAYVVELFPVASITSLMKLCYFIDLVSTKERGDKITEYEYIGYAYGPFDSNIYRDVARLSEGDLIRTQTAYTGTEEYICYLPPMDRDSVDLPDLHDDEKKLIESVVGKLRGYGAKALSEMAYTTKPMKAIGAVMGGAEHIGKKLNLREGLD